MSRYVVRRFLAMIPVLFLVSVLVFGLIHIVPGDPAAVILGRDATPEQIAVLREELGLNDPVLVQYGRWLSGVFAGNLGESLVSKQPVADQIVQKFPTTLSVAVASMLLAVGLGVPLGVLAAVKRNTVADAAVMSLSLLGISVPSFWAGILLIILFSVKLKWLPAVGFVSIFDDFSAGLRFLIMPCLTLGLILTGVVARMTRSSMLEVMGSDYIRTARAKGLSKPVVTFRHGLRNALIPVVTVIGLEFGWLLGGTVVVESVFNIPGMGRMMVHAIGGRDFPLVQGVVLYVATIYVLINLVVDLLYSLLNPRIRYT